MPFFTTVPEPLEYQWFVGNLTAADLPGKHISPKGLQITQIVAMVIGMFAMGLTVDLKQMLKILKRPWGVLIGLLCQFLIMPCIALVAIKTGIFGPYETLIVMLYGTCPGGGISNFFTYYLRLNIDLSVTMTNVSALLSFGMIPLWLLVVPKVITDVEIIVPFKDIAVGVAQLVGPFLVATVINYFYPKQSVVAARYIAAVATLTILVAVVLSCLAYAPTAIITSAQIGLAAIMPLLGCLLGFSLAQLLNFLTAKKANLSLRDCFTIGIETGIQNAQIAITIVQMVYLSQPYIFAQQFFFPIIAFAFQFMYWIFAMFGLMIYRVTQGKSPIPTKAELDQEEFATVNPAFTVDT